MLFDVGWCGWMIMLAGCCFMIFFLANFGGLIFGVILWVIFFKWFIRWFVLDDYVGWFVKRLLVVACCRGWCVLSDICWLMFPAIVFKCFFLFMWVDVGWFFFRRVMEGWFFSGVIFPLHFPLYFILYFPFIFSVNLSYLT